MNGERTKLLDEYLSGGEKIRVKVRGIDQERLHYIPFSEAWSIHENVVHLAESEIVGSVRLRKLVAESGITVDVYDQELWKTHLGYYKQSLDGYLDLFSLLRRLNAELVRSLDDRVWTENYIIHPERGRLALTDWFSVYTGHVQFHLDLIDRNLREFALRKS